MNRDYLIASINLSLARAAWWTAYANTPANLARDVRDGGGRRLTKDELIDNAMITANTHLHNAQVARDGLNNL